TPSQPFDPADFEDSPPPPAPPPPPPGPKLVGTPTKQIDPSALDGNTSRVFVDDPPDPTATDAVSGADAGTADPKMKALAESLD
ncbi:MAG: hypothetical protein ABI467_32470, partial [Kofleriaceae bacterium]